MGDFNDTTTVAGRWLLVERIEDEGWTVCQAAEACAERTDCTAAAPAGEGGLGRIL